MLFSYLNVDKKTELRYRRAKAMENRLNKRDLKILSQERVMRYEQSLSVEEFVRGILADCVEAACHLDTDRVYIPDEKKAEVVVEKKPRVSLKMSRKTYTWKTWLERS